VGRRTSLQSHQTARQPAEECQHLAAPQLLAKNRRPVLSLLKI